jgi:hypothetical protein
MPVFFNFAQVREDLGRFTEGIAHDQLWKDLGGASLGFHLAHLAGSVDRLTTYLIGGQLSEEQLGFLRSEREPVRTLAELRSLIEKSLEGAEASLRKIQPESLYDARTVGRRHLPTTVIGLLVHLAEHTQRHLGQAITISKSLRQNG